MRHKLTLLLLALCMMLPLGAQTRKKKAAPTKPKTVKVDKKTQLKNEKAETEKARKLSQQRAAQLNKDIRTGLDSVLILDHKIVKQQQSIDSLNKDIKQLTEDIEVMRKELARLSNELELRKRKYSRALLYQRRNRSVEQKLMFIFSADNFTQLLRRMRHVHEYTTYQRAQGEMLKAKQAEINEKKNALLEAKARMDDNMIRLRDTQSSLQSMKTRQQSKVTFLNKNLATVQKQIKDYQKREADLNAQIDRIIAEEIEAARRAEAERKRKAEEARRKAEAEKARKLAEARAAAERAAAEKAAAERARKAARTAEERRRAKEAEDRANAEHARAKENVKIAEREDREERRRTEMTWKANNNDAKLSSNFASNKGRLPMPITGGYNIVGHYGRFSPAGMPSVTLDNKGIYIRGQAGCQARAVFDGVVSGVFQSNGRYVVMLRHGTYITVYSGLTSVSVSKGQSVSTRQNLGAIGTNSEGHYEMQFVLSNNGSRMNPEPWVR